MEQPLITKGSFVTPSEERVIEVPASASKVKFKHNGISTCKYNAFTFFPKNMWEQFHKLANAYFLVVAVLQSIPQISVSEGIPNILMPLTFVLTVSAIKDLLEDLKRRRSDNEENNRKAQVRKNGDWAKINWKDIQVGDLVKIEKDQYFPCDLILLSSSEPKGICYIETKNLDGETNLKHKLATVETNTYFDEDSKFDDFSAKVNCETPNPMIYKFNGVICVNGGETLPLTIDQLLLRGSSLRNTGWIVGFTVYTGHETKIMLNSASAHAKYSALEIQMNKQIFYVFMMQITLCLMCSIYYAIWFYNTSEKTEQYLMLSYSMSHWFDQLIVQFFSWMLIFTNFVPISLMVTLEMVKFFQAGFMNQDLKMYYEPIDMPARVQSSNLNEELGQIHYVFSDKTGTLTCNVMEFRKFSLNGNSYGTEARCDPSKKISNVDFNDPSFDPKDPGSLEFLMHLAVCHTIIAENDKEGNLEYQASSPDELALVNAARFFGITFIGRDQENNMIVSVFGQEILVKVLNIAEFSSARKRMSLIVEFPDKKIKIYSKGADSILLPRLVKSPNIDKTWIHLEDYASEGLRTLVLAARDMETSEYESWKQEYLDAMNDIQNREERLEEVFEKIEQQLVLVGATAIEDKLQDGVPQTIAALREAGVKVWVLTGDKIETAINIGYSCQLLTNEMGRLMIDSRSSEGVRNQIQDALTSIETDECESYALVVAGDSLVRAMNGDNIKQFLKITDNSDVVLACRVSPQQKADIVRLIRDSKPNVRTLSIGDGANDVNMILAAHVGIGIAGLEGQQAVRASDYAIAQFAYLKRLMFVHGRESYRKNSTLICYNFYKNVLLVMPLLFYGIFSAFSGQILYNMWNYQLFNIVYCALPIVLYALFDREIAYEVLETDPRYYTVGLQGKLFSTTVFWLWIIEAALQAFFSLTISVYSLCYYSGSNEHGRVDSMFVAGMLVFTMIIFIANTKVFTFSYMQFWFTLLANGLSTLSYIASTAVMTEIMPIMPWLDNFDRLYSTSQMLKNPNTYLAMSAIITLSFMVHPIISHCFEWHKLSKLPTKHKKKVEIITDSRLILYPESQPMEIIEKPRPRAPSVLKIRRHTGFAFSQEAGHTPQITDPFFHRRASKRIKLER